jgi:4-diphosphocytidyl-2-C-methyl-D-erythritol kinase
VSELVEKAPAKINLTLRVLGRREDGYHELESLVAFADVADKLDLEPGEAGDNASLEIIGPFAKACGPRADNLVLKAVQTLRHRKGRLKAGSFILEKNLPVAAGIGGGSADAAAALRLLAKANGMALDDPRITGSAIEVGADVLVCLDPKPRIMRGVGDLLSEPHVLPPLPALLVNPGVPLPTRDVFKRFHGTPNNKKFLANVPITFDGMIGFLNENGNDLMQAAIACAPIISEVLIVLRALPAVHLVRMSGSGPTCFALFRTLGEAQAAARRLQAERKDWWMRATVLGSGP